MPVSRYQNTVERSNMSDLYKEYNRDRGRERVILYKTPVTPPLSYSDLEEVETVGHIWSLGDRFYKLAFDNYEDSEYWWIIAWFNAKPTESHVEIGEVIQIPLDLNKMIEIYFEEKPIGAR